MVVIDCLQALICSTDHSKSRIVWSELSPEFRTGSFCGFFHEDKNEGKGEGEDSLLVGQLYYKFL